MSIRFFKRVPVAVLLTAVVIFLCCFWGYQRVDEPVQEAEEETTSADGHHSGESNLNYYLRWMEDDAEMFSMETADAIARRNLKLDTTYNSVIAIRTVSYLNGKSIEAYARSLAEKMDLSGRDMLLLLDTDTRDWYVLYGSGLQPYAEANTELRDLFRGQLTTDFFESGSNQKALLLFNALETWYENNVPPADSELYPSGGRVEAANFHDIFIGILFTLLTNIWWILLLVLILTLLDRARFSRYAKAHPQGYDPADPFRPLLFWHHAGSRWFADMVELTELEKEELEEEEMEEDPEPSEFP